MKPAVDHQATAAEGDRLQIAEAAGGEVVIDAELVDQLLRIERPAFGVSVEREEGADERQLVSIFALPHVAGDRLVRGEVGQAVLAVQVGIAQVDPELAGNLAVDRTRAAVSRRSAGLLLGRHALHFQMPGTSTPNARGSTARMIAQPLLDIGHDLGAALVAFAELVLRVLGERLHPVADRALRVAEALEDRVHSALQFLELLQAHLVDLVGREVGGCRGLERPTVIFRAVGAGPTRRRCPCRPRAPPAARRSGVRAQARLRR